jgi:hypothetical protein
MTAINSRFLPGGKLENVSPHFFITLDQTAVYFKSKSKCIVVQKGSRSVCARDSGRDAKRCTIVVTVAANNTKQPPFLFSKGNQGNKPSSQYFRKELKDAVNQMLGSINRSTRSGSTLSWNHMPREMVMPSFWSITTKYT